MNVAICGGGTGGHLHPLIALAEELASHDGIEITLFLSRKSPSSALPDRWKVISVEARGFTRGLDSGNLRALTDMIKAYAICLREMKARPPRVAVAFGGYASVPGAAAAIRLGIPLIIHEQNVIPGLANRMLAYKARVLAVSFERTLEYQPKWGKKAVLTGNPLLKRREDGDEDAWDHFGLDRKLMTLAVVGGSQGAASLNRAVLQALPMWKGRKDLQIVHAVGRDKYQEFKVEAAKVDSGGLLYRPFEFIERMDLLYRVADLVVCRAGASTIAELIVEGCPAVLVPYPYATAAHQDANAAVLRDEGAAVVVEDGALNGRRLVEEAEDLMKDPERLHRMSDAAQRLGRPNAAADLAEVVLSRS